MRRYLLTFGAGVVGVLLLAGAAAVLVVSGEIHRQSIVDEADQPADVIIVLGAAEYRDGPRRCSKRASITRCIYTWSI